MARRGLQRTLADFRRHPWLHVISISTITVALVILGGFFLTYRNFNAIADKTGPQVTATLYLKEELAPSVIEALRSRISRLPGVLSAEFRNRASVVADLQSFLGNAGVDTLPGSDLFPDLLELRLQQSLPPKTLHQMKDEVARSPEVVEADFSEDWILQYKKIRQMLDVFGFILLTAILVGCSFIIANFMGMRHQARKDEIDIVRLIGAQGKFVLAPFIWEAAMEGLLGATLAVGILYGIKSALSLILSIQWAAVLGVKEWLYLSPAQFLGVFALGLAIAFCGSFTVFLRFRESAA